MKDGLHHGPRTCLLRRTNGSPATLPGTGQNHTGPTLIVSNAPEIVESQSGVDSSDVLYRAEVPLSGTTTFRIFLWHVNKKGASRTFRIRAKIEGATSLAISSRRYSDDTVSESGNLLALGTELACVQNYGNFDHTDSNATIGTSFSELWSKQVSDDYLVGCLYEFTTAQVQDDISLIIQTSFDTGTPVGDDEPVPAANPNNVVRIRGWWPYSEILFPITGTLDADPEHPGSALICTVVEFESAQDPPVIPPELAATAFGHRSDVADPYGTPKGNKGLYGTKVKYRFQAHNSNSELTGGLNLELRMRNNGGKFAGVGKTVSPSGSNRLIHVLRFDDNPKRSKLDTGASMGIGPGASMAVTCELTPAGAAALPVNLEFFAGTIT